MPNALTSEEITRLVEDFTAVAHRARQVGFGLMELHGGTSYLLAQFLSPPCTNQRAGAYSGDLEQRPRSPWRASPWCEPRRTLTSRQTTAT